MALLEAANEYDALELLHDLGCTDGLPVVVPTPERVERMVLASGLDGDLLLANMAPAMGAATIEKVRGEFAVGFDDFEPIDIIGVGRFAADVPLA